MMALADVLAARARTERATARVACGSLGEVTLEALSVRELEKLSRGEDADRAIFYAACRDLQRVGAELLRQGKVYRPDQVTELVSADEANIAARAVRALSAYQGGQDSREDFAEAPPVADEARRNRGQPRSAAGGGKSEGAAEEVPPLAGTKVHGNGIGTTVSKSGGRIAREDGQGDLCRDGEQERSAPEGNEARVSAGAGAWVDGSVPEGDEVGEDGAQVFSEERGRVAEAAAPSVDADAWADGSAAAEDGQSADEDEVSEVRPGSVQEIAEVRHDTVQQVLTENTKIRHSFVQAGEVGFGDGQVSREFLTEKTDEPAKSGAEQVLWSEMRQTPQNVVGMDKMDGGLRNNEPAADNKPTLRKRKTPNRAHEAESESKPESGGRVHETESEQTGEQAPILHEMTSEITETMHETESESGEIVHETESEFAENVHESTSEITEKLHESKSEKRETLHESESEIAQRVARELLEGLRRAAWVR